MSETMNGAMGTVTAPVATRTYRGTGPMAGMAWVEQGDPEWERMWSALAERGEAIDVPDPDSGECWQYMGTVPVKGSWCHQFRHRCHPVLHSRQYVNLPASAEFLGWLLALVGDLRRADRARRAADTWPSGDYSGAEDGLGNVVSDADPGL